MGTFPLISTFPSRIVLVLMSMHLFFFYYTNAANGAYQTFEPHPETYSIIEIEEVLESYRSQLSVLKEQIHDTRRDLDWLIIKINRIVDSGRSIPKLLNDSVELKEKKISQLERQKKHLAVAVEKYRKMHDRKKNGEKKKTPIQTSSIPELKDRAKKILQSNVPEQLPDIAKAVKEAGLGDWIDVIADGSCAKINNTLPILFSSGSAALAKEYKSFLKKLALFLKPYDVKVYVNGYADPDPIRTPKYPSNLELGASRAANVVHEMVKYGLKPDIFNIGSTGEYRFASKMESSTKNFQRRAQLTVVFSG